MPSALYLASGTSLLFADVAQAEDVLFTLSALAPNTGRVSARYDKGAGAKPGWWEWRLHVQLTGTNLPGATVEVYCFTSDGLNPDGEIGTADAALPSDKRNNGKLLGTLVVDQATTNVTMSKSDTLLIPTRYFSMGIWNATTLPLKTDTAVHGLRMTPFWWEQTEI
jgi:hypothetical protein